MPRDGLTGCLSEIASKVDGFKIFCVQWRRRTPDHTPHRRSLDFELEILALTVKQCSPQDQIWLVQIKLIQGRDIHVRTKCSTLSLSDAPKSASTDHRRTVSSGTSMMVDTSIADRCSSAWGHTEARICASSSRRVSTSSAEESPALWPWAVSTSAGMVESASKKALAEFTIRCSWGPEPRASRLDAIVR